MKPRISHRTQEHDLHILVVSPLWGLRTLILSGVVEQSVPPCIFFEDQYELHELEGGLYQQVY